MKRILGFEKSTLRALGVLASLMVGVACGAVASDSLKGSETHFLERCTTECGGGLECIGNVCTLACGGDTECSGLSSGAACVSESCTVQCVDDGECRAKNGAWECVDGNCVRSAVAPAASPASNPEPRCPTFVGGVAEPIEIEASVEAVPGSSNAGWVHADASGVYWIDRDGAVLGLKKGESAPSVLRAAPSTPATYLGLISDETHLYWTEAEVEPPGPPSADPPPPPGRVLTLSKEGGTPELLVESAELVLLPVGFDSEGRLFVRSYEEDLYEVTTSGGLQRVATVPDAASNLQMVAGRAYWSERNEAGPGSVVFAATPSSPPARLTAISVETFKAGPGVVLWAPEELRTNPLLLVQYWMMFDESTGCAQRLPSVELSIGQTLVDARHVYWQSFNALGAVGPGTSYDLAPLLRVNLRTGRFERVATPGLEITVVEDLMAQDETTIYVSRNSDKSLFALRKPD